MNNEEENNMEEEISMYTRCKFSEMPGFLEYQEVLAENGVHVEDRMITFIPTDYMRVDEEVKLIVMGSKYKVKDYYYNEYVEDPNDPWFIPRDPKFIEAKVVACDALFAYGEQALFNVHWQWCLIDGRYYNDFKNSADCYYSWMDGYPATEYRDVVKGFNEDSQHYWLGSGINCTSRTDSVKWMLWMPRDILQFMDKLKKEGLA